MLAATALNIVSLRCRWYMILSFWKYLNFFWRNYITSFIYSAPRPSLLGLLSLTSTLRSPASFVTYLFILVEIFLQSDILLRYRLKLIICNDLSVNMSTSSNTVRPSPCSLIGRRISPNLARKFGILFDGSSSVCWAIVSAFAAKQHDASCWKVTSLSSPLSARSFLP